jgi:hypothetical protein
MGEYITLDGHVTKIGTCEDLFYARWQDLARWVAEGRAGHVGGNLEPRQYLADGSGFRFRFPFPDEDGRGQAAYDDYGRFARVLAPVGFASREDVQHDGLHLPITSAGNGGQWLSMAYVLLPCPVAAQWSTVAGVRLSPDPLPSMVDIVQQRRIGDQLWTVVRCPYCGALWRLPVEWARELAEHILDAHRGGDADQDMLREVARRMMRGYAPGALEWRP